MSQQSAFPWPEAPATPLPHPHLQTLLDLMDGGEIPDAATLPDGLRARLGLFLESLGKALQDEACANVGKRLDTPGSPASVSENGVTFHRTAARTLHLIDADRVRAAYPPQANPELYTSRRQPAAVRPRLDPRH